MPRGRKRKRVTTSTGHLDAFAVGGIAALEREGYSHREIADSGAVLKPDGSSVTFGKVGQVIRHLQEDSNWRGERTKGSGPPRVTTPAEDKAMVQTVLARRGKERVTSGKVRRKMARAVKKRVSERTVRRRLREAGLRWLRRRRSTWVPEPSRVRRNDWADTVKKCNRKFLRRWVYTEGCSFYLDRSEAEADENSHAALGLYVWRFTEQRDALFQDCVGPSSYRKAQGERVRVWGLLVGGSLHIRILEQGVNMNRWEYAKLIKNSFPGWLRGVRHPFLIQDYEACLWCAEPAEACKAQGIEVSKWHPKHSPDLNAIENAWGLLRKRLAETQPAGRESRDAFMRRLRAAVAWINRHQASTLRKYARNQKERADDVKAHDGNRTRW